MPPSSSNRAARFFNASFGDIQMGPSPRIETCHVYQ